MTNRKKSQLCNLFPFRVLVRFGDLRLFWPRALALVAVLLSYHAVLSQLGFFLVHDEELRKADDSWNFVPALALLMCSSISAETGSKATLILFKDSRARTSILQKSLPLFRIAAISGVAPWAFLTLRTALTILFFMTLWFWPIAPCIIPFFLWTMAEWGPALLLAVFVPDDRFPSYGVPGIRWSVVAAFLFFVAARVVWEGVFRPLELAPLARKIDTPEE